jgi:hypothetical protein
MPPPSQFPGPSFSDGRSLFCGGPHSGSVPALTSSKVTDVSELVRRRRHVCGGLCTAVSSSSSESGESGVGIEGKGHCSSVEYREGDCPSKQADCLGV